MKIIFKLLVATYMIACMFSCEQASEKIGPKSGYKYEIIKSGSGPKVKAGEYAFFDYEVYSDTDSLLNSMKNNPQRPSIQAVGAEDESRAENPFIDIISELSVGDSVRIIIPTDSMQNLPPNIASMTALHHHVSIHEAVDEETFKARQEKARIEMEQKMAVLRERFPSVDTLAQVTIEQYKADELELEVTENGVKYLIHEKGDGVVPEENDLLTMQYYGALVSDGTKFDDSFSRGQGFSFPLGQGRVIDGWDEAMANLPVGTKASLFIPSALGYGENGAPPTIPANSELYFYVEVESVQN